MTTVRKPIRELAPAVEFDPAIAATVTDGQRRTVEFVNRAMNDAAWYWRETLGTVAEYGCQSPYYLREHRRWMRIVNYFLVRLRADANVAEKLSIRPLEWHRDAAAGKDCHAAASVFGKITVQREGGKWVWCCKMFRLHVNTSFGNGTAGSKLEAMTAAEAWYRDRILTSIKIGELPDRRRHACRAAHEALMTATSRRAAGTTRTDLEAESAPALCRQVLQRARVRRNRQRVNSTNRLAGVQ